MSQPTHGTDDALIERARQWCGDYDDVGPTQDDALLLMEARELLPDLAASAEAAEARVAELEREVAELRKGR